MKINVLLTGAGGNLAHFIHNALMRSSVPVRVVACDYSSNAVGLFLAESGYVVPPAKEDGYVARIMDICQKEHIHVIMAGGIAEMRILAVQRDYIRNQCGAFVVASSPQALHRMEDKWELSQALIAHGFDAPFSVLPADKEALESFLVKYSFPCIVKDRMGAGGSTGVGVAHDMKQLAYLIENINNPVVQEYLYPDNEEYTVGAFVGADGHGKASIVMKRELGLGMTFKGHVLADSDLGRYGERILEALGCTGPANLQLRLTERGPVVFEINPRFSSTTSARAYYGYNEPEMCIRHFCMNEEIKRPQIVSGRFFRTIEDVFVEEEDFQRVAADGHIDNSVKTGHPVKGGK